MYAYERSLVEKYRSRPFVLLGVNTDSDRDVARQAALRHAINWRSWWAAAADGDIPARWQVTAFPSLFLIDARGVVRQAHVEPGPALERAIESLLREAAQ
jgi:hypothetical protein